MRVQRILALVIEELYQTLQGLLFVETRGARQPPGEQKFVLNCLWPESYNLHQVPFVIRLGQLRKVW